MLIPDFERFFLATSTIILAFPASVAVAAVNSS